MKEDPRTEYSRLLADGRLWQADTVWHCLHATGSSAGNRNEARRIIACLQAAEIMFCQHRLEESKELLSFVTIRSDGYQRERIIALRTQIEEVEKKYAALELLARAKATSESARRAEEILAELRKAGFSTSDSQRKTAGILIRAITEQLIAGVKEINNKLKKYSQNIKDDNTEYVQNRISDELNNISEYRNIIKEGDSVIARERIDNEEKQSYLYAKEKISNLIIELEKSMTENDNLVDKLAETPQRSLHVELENIRMNISTGEYNIAENKLKMLRQERKNTREVANLTTLLNEMKAIKSSLLLEYNELLSNFDEFRNKNNYLETFKTARKLLMLVRKEYSREDMTVNITDIDNNVSARYWETLIVLIFDLVRMGPLWRKIGSLYVK